MADEKSGSFVYKDRPSREELEKGGKDKEKEKEKDKGGKEKEKEKGKEKDKGGKEKDKGGKDKEKGGKDKEKSSKKKKEGAAEGGGRKAVEGRVVRGTKAPEIPIFERKNWLIHLHYIRKDFETCKVLAKEMLAETDELCEYAIYILGLVNRQEGDLHASLELFQKAVLLSPNHAPSVKQVARSQFLLGHHGAALETYNEAAVLSPNDWEILHNQGVCCFYLKDYDKAVEYYLGALELSPQTVTYKELGRVYLLTGSLENAVDIYKKAVKWDPEDSDLLTTLGLLHLQLGEPQQAFEALGGALTFDPYHGTAILAAGGMMQESGDFDVALSKYRVAAGTIPESPQLWNNIGMCNFGKKKFVASISCLKRAAYLAPLEWEVMYNLGLVHLSTQQFASAFHFLRAASSFKPKCGLLYMLLAITLTRLQDLDNANLMYQEALKLEKENPLIHINYAVFLFNKQERTLATQQLKLYNAALRNHKPNNPDPEMFELGNKMAPVLQLGEELVAPPPSVTEGKKAPTSTNIIGSGSEDSTESSERERDRSQSYFDKTTPTL